MDSKGECTPIAQGYPQEHLKTCLNQIPVGYSVLYITESEFTTSFLPPLKAGGKLTELDQDVEAGIVQQTGKNDYGYKIPTLSEMDKYPEPVILTAH